MEEPPFFNSETPSSPHRPLFGEKILSVVDWGGGTSQQPFPANGFFWPSEAGPSPGVVKKIPGGMLGAPPSQRPSTAARVGPGGAGTDAVRARDAPADGAATGGCQRGSRRPPTQDQGPPTAGAPVAGEGGGSGVTHGSPLCPVGGCVY